MMFKEIIPVYTQNHKEPTNAKCAVDDDDNVDGVRLCL
jgi:hypothetical protein